MDLPVETIKWHIQWTYIGDGHTPFTDGNIFSTMNEAFSHMERYVDSDLKWKGYVEECKCK